MNVDLTKNPNQLEFYQKAIEAIYGKNDFRNLNYGGAIRGGKSFVCAAIWLTAAKYFQNSRWHIFRADFPALQSSTIPTIEKIVQGSDNWGWNRDRSNYFLYHKKSDGKIFFRGENITHDPELDDLLGLETNGIWYEQIEELSEKLFDMGMSRNGSWYIDPMPIPITLSTFNPTQRWIKKKIYEPWIKGELKAPYYFQKALPQDNSFVTAEQWAAWGMMADRYKKQFIEGDWNDFTDKNNLWAFAFDRNKHIVTDSQEMKPDRRFNLYLSFDFNRNPICCSVIQHYDNEIKVIETIKLSNSNIYAICDHILVSYPGYLYIVTGDASGQSSSALVKDNLNYYTVIKQKLNLANNQLKVPKVNPRLEENQVLFNSILTHYSVKMNETKCAQLIYDCQNVRTTSDGGIQKENRNDPAQQADAIDTLRYWFNIFMWDFLRKI